MGIDFSLLEKRFTNMELVKADWQIDICGVGLDLQALIRTFGFE